MRRIFASVNSRLSGLFTAARRFSGSHAAIVAVRVAGTGLTFLLTVLLARLMGPDGYGVYSYAIAIVTLLAVLTQLGLPTLIVREVARYEATASWNLLRGLLSRAALFVVLMSILLIVIVISLIAFFSSSKQAIQWATLMWALVLLPTIAFNACGGAALRGLGYIIRGQLAEQVVRPGMLLVLLGCAVVLAGPEWVSPPRGMALHAAASIVAFLFGVALLLRNSPSSLRSASSAFQDERKWKSSLIPLSLLVGLQVITSQTDILMLGVFVDAEDIGVYRVAWQGASLVNLMLFAIGLSVEPAIARLHGLGERTRLQALVKKSGRTAFIISLFMSLVLVLFGRQLLTWIFGDAFAGSYVPLAILCVGQVALAYAGWAVLVLNMTGNERTTLRITAYAAVVNVAANAVLIPVIGLIGAAIATASTMFAWKLGLAYAARRVAGIHTMVTPHPIFRKRGE